MPKRAVRPLANARLKRGDLWCNVRTKRHAPSKQRSVIQRPLIQHVECPRAVQRTSQKVTEIATWQVRFRKNQPRLDGRPIWQRDRRVVDSEGVVNPIDDVQGIHVP